MTNTTLRRSRATASLHGATMMQSEWAGDPAEPAVLHDGRHPYVPRMEHNLTVRRLTAEKAALTAELEQARAEVDRLNGGICSLLLHDSRGGRVAVPLLARLLVGAEFRVWKAVR